MPQLTIWDTSGSIKDNNDRKNTYHSYLDSLSIPVRFEHIPLLSMLYDTEKTGAARAKIRRLITQLLSMEICAIFDLSALWNLVSQYGTIEGGTWQFQEHFIVPQINGAIFERTRDILSCNADSLVASSSDVLSRCFGVLNDEQQQELYRIKIECIKAHINNQQDSGGLEQFLLTISPGDRAECLDGIKSKFQSLISTEIKQMTYDALVNQNKWHVSHREGWLSEETMQLIAKTRKEIVRPEFIKHNYQFGEFGTRFHFFTAKQDSTSYCDSTGTLLVGDILKRAILDKFTKDISRVSSVDELNKTVAQIKKTVEYEILCRSQGLTTYLFKFFIKTSSEQALEEVIYTKQRQLNSNLDSQIK